MPKTPPDLPPTPPSAASSAALPATAPIFPLTGVLLLPGMRLPLHIFEPRYRNMVADALQGGGHIAIVQPIAPAQDNAPPEYTLRGQRVLDPGALPQSDDAPASDRTVAVPPVYAVACLGRIVQCEQATDGRYALVLAGASRLRIREELPLVRGYRRVLTDYSEYARDPDEPSTQFDPARLLAELEELARRDVLTLDQNTLRSLSGPALINGLSMSLPLAPQEKQALLEAPTLQARQEVLLQLLRMGLDNLPNDTPNPVPPTLN